MHIDIQGREGGPIGATGQVRAVAACTLTYMGGRVNLSGPQARFGQSQHDIDIQGREGEPIGATGQVRAVAACTLTYRGGRVNLSGPQAKFGQ